MPKCRICQNQPVFCKSIRNILFRQEKPLFFIRLRFAGAGAVEGWRKKKTAKRCMRNCLAVLTVPPDVLFSNQFLEDLDKLWELRQWIPDPTKPILPPNLAKRL